MLGAGLLVWLAWLGGEVNTYSTNLPGLLASMSGSGAHTVASPLSFIGAGAQASLANPGGEVREA